MPPAAACHSKVVVLDDATVNAFVLPGGKIVVFNGARLLAGTASG
jgi:predicted Zn-dependent protease